MTQQFIGHKNEWIAIADIDYLSQFIKAWIPFNVWYNISFQNLNSDREHIEHICESNNPFKDKIENLLRDNGTDGENFRNFLGSLIHQLDRTSINNKGERITLSGYIKIRKNTINERTKNYRSWTFTAKRISKNKYKLTANNGRQDKFSYEQNKKFDISDIKNQDDFKELSVNQQNLMLQCYVEVEFMKSEKIIAEQNESDVIFAGRYRLINDAETIARAIILTLYKLRCSLIHGEIIPNNDTKKVYEPAYHILRMLLEAIR